MLEVRPEDLDGWEAVIECEFWWNPMQPIVDIQGSVRAVAFAAGMDAADRREAGLPYRPDIWRVSLTALPEKPV